MIWPRIRGRQRAQQEAASRRAKEQEEAAARRVKEQEEADARRAKEQLQRELREAEAYASDLRKIQEHQEEERRQAEMQHEAAEAQRRQANEAKARAPKKEQTRQKHITTLQIAKSKYEDEIHKLAITMGELEADLEHIRHQDYEETQREKNRNSWPVYMASFVYGKAHETDDQKQTRQVERQERFRASHIMETRKKSKQD